MLAGPEVLSSVLLLAWEALNLRYLVILVAALVSNRHSLVSLVWRCITQRVIGQINATENTAIATVQALGTVSNAVAI